VSRRFAVNSSPLILLGRISRLDLLPALAEQVVVLGTKKKPAGRQRSQGAWLRRSVFKRDGFLAWSEPNLVGPAFQVRPPGSAGVSPAFLCPPTRYTPGHRPRIAKHLRAAGRPELRRAVQSYVWPSSTREVLARIPVTHRRVAGGFAVVTGHCMGRDRLDWEAPRVGAPETVSRESPGTLSRGPHSPARSLTAKLSRFFNTFRQRVSSAGFPPISYSDISSGERGKINISIAKPP